MFGLTAVKTLLTGKPRVTASRIEITPSMDDMYIGRMAQNNALGITWYDNFPYHNNVSIVFNGLSYSITKDGRHVQTLFDDSEAYYFAKTLAMTGKRSSIKKRLPSVYDVTGQNYRMIQKSYTQFKSL